MLARRFRIGVCLIVVLAVIAIAGCRGHQRGQVHESYRSHQIEQYVAPPMDPRGVIRPAPPTELLIPPMPTEPRTAPTFLPPLPSGDNGPGLIQPKDGNGPETRSDSNAYFQSRLRSGGSTRRDPIAEPVETERKLVPADSTPPNFFGRLGASFRRITNTHGGS